MNTLQIKSLNLTYPNKRQAVKDLSIEIRNGMFGLLGPNGAGKSSLMKIIVGLQRPNQGSINFNGSDILKDPALIKKSLGFLPQDFGVYSKASAYELLNHIGILKGIKDKKERNTQIYDLLAKVNLLDFKDKEVYQFSGGMKQRFGIAQALLGDPKIIIVDEPTAGLDPEERNRFNILLNNISKGIIVILSSHIVEDIQNLCSEVAIMHRGEILNHGTPLDLIQPLVGKLWSKSIELDEVQWYGDEFQIISQKLIEGKLMLTVLHDQQPEGFQPIKPSLEHAYFASIGHN